MREWIFLAPIAVSVVFFAIVFMRIAKFLKVIRDPEALGRMLSEQVRAALEERGIDPDAVDLKTLQEDPETAELVGRDVRNALQGGLMRGGFVLRGAGAGASGTETRGASPAPRSASISGRHVDGSFRPEPIDRGRGAGSIALVAAVALLVLLAYFLIAP